MPLPCLLLLLEFIAFACGCAEYCLPAFLHLCSWRGWFSPQKAWRDATCLPFHFLLLKKHVPALPLHTCLLLPHCLHLLCHHACAFTLSCSQLRHYNDSGWNDNRLERAHARHCRGTATLFSAFWTRLPLRVVVGGRRKTRWGGFCLDVAWRLRWTAFVTAWVSVSPRTGFAAPLRAAAELWFPTVHTYTCRHRWTTCCVRRTPLPSGLPADTCT